MTYDCLCRIMRLHDILEDRKSAPPESQGQPSPSRDFTKYTRDEKHWSKPPNPTKDPRDFTRYT